MISLIWNHSLQSTCLIAAPWPINLSLHVSTHCCFSTSAVHYQPQFIPTLLNNMKLSCDRECTLPSQYFQVAYSLCILFVFVQLPAMDKKATIHQLTTMLSTFKKVLFPDHIHHANHWCWWPFTLIIALGQYSNCHVIISVPMVSRWSWPGNRTILKVDSLVVSWWIVFFCAPKVNVTGSRCLASLT